LSQATIAANADWFQDNDQYVESMSQLECYRNIRSVVERELRGVRRLLDVGNGGFFNYDTSAVAHVTAVDLFLTDGEGPLPNVRRRRGSLLDLPFPPAQFDCVLVQNVLHHVTGRTPAENHSNLERCLAEIARCVEPNGKAVVIESTVNEAFHAFERLAFPVAVRLKRGGHPVTFQFSPRHLVAAAARAGMRVDELTYIPRGPYLLQFGYRWPSVLTPARPVKLVLVK
jgi:SAM-dependent methyltransferase